MVVLAGDIAAQLSGLDWAASQSAFAGKPIVYVIGNHECYGTEFLAMRTKIRRRAEALQQAGHEIFVHDNDALVLGGVRFLGSTLWTD